MNKGKKTALAFVAMVLPAIYLGNFVSTFYGVLVAIAAVGGFVVGSLEPGMLEWILSKFEKAPEEAPEETAE